ncbi:hypothetical protein GCM10023320_46100 [Pseudonocardia adelaidensis]|uniref:Methyltransferase type 11 domain-containing protein n=1 Tax=Pseudonocardia adelaidensis TaxID=648754 RepID=A0ABP9NRA6_9PSEU
MLGLGLGTVGVPAIGSVFRTVPPGSAAQGSALLYAFNQLGAALGIAVGALLVGVPDVASIGSFRPGFWLLVAAVLVGLVASTRLPGRAYDGSPEPVEAPARRPYGRIMPGSPAPSFGTVAATYARHRPGYPAEAVAWALAPLGEPPERLRLHLLDLGAGTGKLTEALVGRVSSGGRVTAVDPDPAMLAQLRSRHPSVDVREGTAERIPLPNASADAVLVGQAFHWFDRDRAMPEIARVLRPGGVLAALWIGSDVRVGWVRGFHEAGSWDPDAQFHDDAKRFPEGYGVAPGEFARFPFTTPTTLDDLMAEISTHSWVLTTPLAEREAGLARARAYLARRPEISGGEFELPRIADVLRARRAAGPPRP